MIRNKLMLLLEMYKENDKLTFFVVSSKPWVFSEDEVALFDEKMFVGLPAWTSIAKYVKNQVKSEEHNLPDTVFLDISKKLEG